jgi:hypothetical protein
MIICVFGPPSNVEFPIQEENYKRIGAASPTLLTSTAAGWVYAHLMVAGAFVTIASINSPKRGLCTGTRPW